MSKPPKAAGKQSVQVFCRIRPTNSRELATGAHTCVKHGDESIEIKSEETGENKFNFDAIFGMDSTQEQVFLRIAGDLIIDVLGGYNATILAYGQSGTGKTHTMEGDLQSNLNKGIIPRAVDALFEGVTEADENIEFTFKVSYVEIYLEKIRDLLDEHRTKVNLTVREDKIKGIYIAGVTEEYVTSSDETLAVMYMGASNRAVAATGLNSGSSRSHSVFTITVSQKDVNTSASKSGKLVLVDLAGSEMVRKSNASGQQLEEAKMINKSLSALGQVINALTDKNINHVPYRDSKLTRILQDSLGGNSKTALMVAVSPSSFNSAETVSTLRFGMRAKSIENKVTINQTRSVEELEVLLVRAEKAIDAQTSHIMAISIQLQAAQGKVTAYEKGGALPEPDSASASGSGSSSSSSSASSSDDDSDSDDAEGEKEGEGEAGAEVEAKEGAKTEGEGVEAGTETDSPSSLPPPPSPPPSSPSPPARPPRLSPTRPSPSHGNSGSVTMPKGKGDVIQSLQETIIQLGHELDEEREENLRKSQEITQITQMLVEKERLVAEGAAMLQGAQRNNELLKERAEVALREKIEALGELGHLKQTHVEDGEKAKFQVMELEVSLNTLQTENQHLKVEIAEMSGDAEPAARPKESDHTPKKRVITGMSPEEEDERRGDGNRDRDRDSRDRGDKGGSGTPRASSVKGSGSGSTLEVLSAGERQGLWESASSNFASLCVQQGLGEEETGELLGVWEGYAADSDRAFAALEERTASSDRSNRKRLKDLEEQRSRLEKDLQGRVEKMVELQLRVDNQSSGEEDEGHLRSLQQRLEQLVAVHRQLLRKFASLELESVELKKKTQLRDERIRQLEASGRGMISNIRVQAEKHLGELGALREQMVILRSEHEYRVEQLRDQQQQDHRGTGPRTIGGGGGGVGKPPQKSLRGGGGQPQSSSFNWRDGTSKQRAIEMGETSVESRGLRGGGGNGGDGDGDDESVCASDQAVGSPAPVKSSVFSRLVRGQK